MTEFAAAEPGVVLGVTTTAAQARSATCSTSGIATRCCGLPC